MVRRISSRNSQSITPASNSTNWASLIDTRGIPPSSSQSGQSSGSPSAGHTPHLSSEGDHSPSQGCSSEPESWHEAFHQADTDNDAGISQESFIGDNRLPIEFNDK